MRPRGEKESAEDRQQGRWLHPTVVATGWVSLFNDMSSEMIYPLLPIFLTQSLGLGVGFVGLIEGLAESTTSLVRPFSGWLSDRLRRRKALVLLGYLVASVARPLIALTTAGWHVLGLRLTDRLGKGVRGAPRDALVADVTEESKRGLAYGYQRAMDHAGAIIGPLLATLLLARYVHGLRTLFALAAVPAFLCLLTVWWFVKDPTLHAVAETHAGSIGAVFSSWRRMDKGLKRLLLVVGLFALGNSSDAFLLLRARDLGVGLALIPLIWVVLHVSKSLLSIPGGILSDRIGRRPTILAGWVIYGVVYTGFAYSHSYWHAWALFAAYGVYFALTEGVEKAFVADMVKSRDRGIAFGQYNFVIGIAALPASLLFGGIWDMLGAEAAFVFGALLALGASTLLLIFIRPSGEQYETA